MRKIGCYLSNCTRRSVSIPPSLLIDSKDMEGCNENREEPKIQHKWLWTTLKVLGLYLPPRSIPLLLYCSTLFLFIEFNRRVLISWYVVFINPSMIITDMSSTLTMTSYYFGVLLVTSLLLLIIPFYRTYGKLENTWIESLKDLRQIGIQHDTAEKQRNFGLVLTVFIIITFAAPLCPYFIKKDSSSWYMGSLLWSTVKYSTILDPLFCYYAMDAADLLKTISESIRDGSCTPFHASHGVSIVEKNIRALNGVFGKTRLLVILNDLVIFIYAIYWAIFDLSVYEDDFNLFILIPFQFVWLVLSCSLGDRIKSEV